MRQTAIKHRHWLAPAASLGSALALAAGLTAAPAAAATPPRQAVAGTHPSWASPAAAVNQVPADTNLSARVYLAGRDPAGLAAYARQVSEPGSASYGRYLTPAQYQQRFGPSAAQVSAVRAWLTGAGLRVTTVTSHYVGVSGTEAAVAAAFGTSLRTYRVAGTLQRAPQAAVTVPAAVAAAVLTVTGLATSDARLQSDVSTGPAGQPAGLGATPGAAGPMRPAAASNADCSRYWDQQVATTLPPAYGHELPYVVCGYVPAQLRSAYGVAHSGLTGKGVTIAIVDPGASPTIASDADTYFRRHGLPAFRPGQFTQYLPADIGQSCGTGQAPYGEESLDVEAAHTMAPAARIAFVASDCTSITDPLDAETRIVDGHLADIVSDSWHLGLETQMPAGLIPAFEQVFEQGAIEGIGFYFSSGDHGDWSQATPGGAPAVQYPGIDPWVTSVGGTSLAVSARGGYEWETGWGIDLAPLAADGTNWTTLPGAFDGGAGGGTSTLFAQPFYQRGVVPSDLARPAGAAQPMRVMPDIAADADPSTGMLIGLSLAPTPTSPPVYTEGTAGGTSVATPLIAGIQADAEQALGRPIGFADPAVYARYGTRAYHDVTDDPLGPGVTIAAAVGDAGAGAGLTTSYADTFARDTSLRATRGYDDITGVGSPTAAYLRSYRRR